MNARDWFNRQSFNGRLEAPRLDLVAQDDGLDLRIVGVGLGLLGAVIEDTQETK